MEFLKQKLYNGEDIKYQYLSEDGKKLYVVTLCRSGWKLYIMIGKTVKAYEDEDLVKLYDRIKE